MSSNQENTITDKFKAFISVVSSRRTLLGTMALIFIIGLTIGLASSQQQQQTFGHSDLTQSVLEPYSNPFVAYEDDQEGQTKIVKKRAPQGGARESFTLSEIVDNQFSAESWNGTWVSDNEYAYRNLGKDHNRSPKLKSQNSSR